MPETQPFFTYGLLKHPGMLEILTGRQDIQRAPATLKDFGLFIQRIDQVPNIAIPGLPEHLAPQKILRENWGDDFQSYMIRPKEGGQVVGDIAELTQDEIDFIAEWELEELGWYRPWEGTAVTEDGREVHVKTDGGRVDQEIDREVDGLNYETLLPGQSIEKYKKVYEMVRKEYDEKRFAHEGTGKTPESI